MVTSNSINANSTGLVKYDGAGTFSGVTVTQHDLLIGAASNGITSVAPSATSGVPVISQGASADPAFGTAVVAGGGTGIASTTAYAPICGGTTTTGALQSASTNISNSGYVFTSNGSSALPSWQSPSALGSLVLLNTQTASNSASLSFTSTYITTAYKSYFIKFTNILPATNGSVIKMDLSTDNGSTFLTNNNAGVNWTAWNGVATTNINTTATCQLTHTIPNNYGCSGQIFIHGLVLGTAVGPHYTGQFFAPFNNMISFGCNTNSVTVNNLKFSMDSGNITSGTISLYGIAQ